MAGSVVSAIALNKIPKSDPNFLRPAKNFAKLDVVVNANGNAGNTSSKRNSIQKIADFKPIQLKNFSAEIKKSIAQRKQSAQVRQAIDRLTKEKVQATRKENPLAKNSPVEAQSGGKINFSA